MECRSQTRSVLNNNSQIRSVDYQAVLLGPPSTSRPQPETERDRESEGERRDITSEQAWHGMAKLKVNPNMGRSIPLYGIDQITCCTYPTLH